MTVDDQILSRIRAAPDEFPDANELLRRLDRRDLFPIVFETDVEGEGSDFISLISKEFESRIIPIIISYGKDDDPVGRMWFYNSSGKVFKGQSSRKQSHWELIVVAVDPAHDILDEVKRIKSILEIR
jgi:hypothetical protein